MVKRLLPAVLALLLPAAVLMAGGIGSAKDYTDFVNACNAGGDLSAWMDADSTVVLTADLDFSKVKKLPQVAFFTGRFDGHGHRIMGWKAHAGLFAQTAEGSEIRSLVIDRSCTAKIASKSTEYNFGFIADINGGLIADCVNEGSISHSCNYTSNIIRIGGLVGMNMAYLLRCRNAGNIESECTGTEQKNDLALQVGGVTGGCTTAKKNNNPVVARCVNDGAVTVAADFPVPCVGGITGLAGNCPVKECVNNGRIEFTGIQPENGNLVPEGRVGGIAGTTKNHISSCDNHGDVSACQYANGNCGGICGQPHKEIVIADCVNYGRVSSSTENSSQVGGIAGNVGRPVHFRRCINRGEVAFEGLSQRKRSTAGGIVGQVYCPKTSPGGAYIRNCANYGAVSSVSGGNNFTNANAIHTGGIVGFMTTLQGYRSFLADCCNKGTVTARGGRRGNICASVGEFVKTGGPFPDDDAVSVAPDGANVSGCVLDENGNPVPDVTVTDGEQCVRTDAAGYYRMQSDLSRTSFIYISIPAGAFPSCVDGIPQFYRRVSRDQKAVRADFTLTRKPVARDFTVMMIGDPQVRPYGMDNSMEQWNDSVSRDAEAFRASTPGEVYCINLGDLVYNYMSAYDDYIDAAKQIKCPIFNVIGNHDFDQTNMFDTSLGNVFYLTYISPDHYSFDIGEIHFVVVNSIMYDRTRSTDSYSCGLDDRTMKWLENDLSYVGKDRTIVVCSHAQLFKKRGNSPNGSHGAYNRNYAKYCALLAAYSKVYSWSGHYHKNFYYDYAGKDSKWGAPNIECVSVSRATGALRYNKYLNTDGTPQGYMVLNVHGTSFDWYYKSVGRDKSFQMRVLPSGGDGAVSVNIWNWGEGWTTPRWYEDGEYVSDMEYCPGTDPEYVALYEACDNKTTRKYCKPATDCNIFRIIPTPGVKTGEIRVKDQFGNEYCRFWDFVLHVQREQQVIPSPRLQ